MVLTIVTWRTRRECRVPHLERDVYACIPRRIQVCKFESSVFPVGSAMEDGGSSADHDEPVMSARYSDAVSRMRRRVAGSLDLESDETSAHG